MAETTYLLNGLLDLGIRLIDTAPAYGESEVRIGQAVSHRRNDFVLCTKTGEQFVRGESHYDFSRIATIASVEQSLRRLRTDYLDVVLVHSNGRDRFIQTDTDVIATLQALKQQGLVRAIGFSGKTTAGAEAALAWADVLMVEYHLSDPSHADVMRQAHERGVGVLVKKGLASGVLPAAESLRFVLGNADVDSVVIGGLNLGHFRSNLATTEAIFSRSAA